MKLLGLSSATAKFGRYPQMLSLPPFVCVTDSWSYFLFCIFSSSDVLWTKMTEYVGSRSLSDIELHARVYFALLDAPMKQSTDSHTNQFCSDANAASTDANSFRIPLMPLSTSQYKCVLLIVVPQRLTKIATVLTFLYKIYSYQEL